MLSVALGTLGTWLMRRWALAHGFVDRPGMRKLHQAPIALGGGVVIFWVTLAPLIVAAVLGAAFRLGFASAWLTATLAEHVPGLQERLPALSAVLTGAAALHILGLIDDRRALGPKLKLAIQLAVALLLATVGEIRLSFFIESALVTTILSVLWIGLIINVFNFLDNMDGLSAGVAVICAGVLLVPAWQGGQFFVGIMLAGMMGALVGFLFFNFAPARIFMGDAGSMVVGMLVAVGTVRTTYYYQDAPGGRWFAALTPLVVLAVPLYDFVSVTFIRLRQGRSPFVGDQQHFSHRLVKRGLRQRDAVLTIYLATLCTGLGALALRYVPPAGAVLVFVQTVGVLALVAILEATDDGRANGGQG